MTCVSKLRYSPTYKVVVDLEDMWVADVSRANKSANFGKHIPMKKYGRYISKNHFRKCFNRVLLLHRVVADACVRNPRPDVFNVVDHKDHNTVNNHPSNLRWVNAQLNQLNLNPTLHDTPPGVSEVHQKTKTGKWYTKWRITKNARAVWYTKSKQVMVDYALIFNKNYFDALYQAYLLSPPKGSDNWKPYWRERFIPAKGYCYEKHSQQVRDFKLFIVDNNFYKKMC